MSTKESAPKVVTFIASAGNYSFLLRKEKDGIVYDHKGNPIRHKGAQFIDFDQQGRFSTDDPEVIKAMREHPYNNVRYFEDKGMKEVGSGGAMDGYRVPYNALRAMNRSELLEVASRLPGVNLLGKTGEGETVETLLEKICKAFGYNMNGQPAKIKEEEVTAPRTMSTDDEDEEDETEDEEDEDGTEDEEDMEDEGGSDEGTEADEDGVVDDEEEAGDAMEEGETEEGEVEEEATEEEEEEEVKPVKKAKVKGKKKKKK